MISENEDNIENILDRPEEKDLRCGMVSIVGRPNVGKSTLVNRILGEKVAIVSKIPQTTRTQIRGVFNDERGQIIFIDTPGLHLGGDNLDRFMNKASIGSLDGIDCVIHLVDTSRTTGQEELNVIQHLKRVKVPIIIGLNKVDLKAKHIDQYISLWEQETGKTMQELENLTLLPLSGQEGTNVDKLLDLIFEKLPVTHPFYERDVICDIPRKLAVSDIIREKFLHIMRDEVPHSLAVVIEEMRPKKGKVFLVRALILVERDTQKEIVIGKKGEILKKVGSKARTEIEELIGCKVFLEMYVKTQKKWRDNHYVLDDLGYVFD